MNDLKTYDKTDWEYSLALTDDWLCSGGHSRPKYVVAKARR